MDIIGIIAEFNPFHKGHLYYINKIKEMYPNSILVLVLNGYFTERGDISIESKEEKTRLALKYAVDIVLELPVLYGTSSADIFAETSITMLNNLGVEKIIFGSESCDINMLKQAASIQLSDGFNDKVKSYLDKGLNYPTALNKAIGISIDSPNDLLGISYIKAILKNHFDIKPICIQRTNSYHDINSNEEIISASNIRNKIINSENIDKYIPEGKIDKVDYKLLFTLIKYKILTDDLSIYETVDEGIENKLKKEILNSNSLDELINNIKSKRYTYNRLSRMLTHILLGIKKNDSNTKLSYVRLLGFSSKGKDYINSIKKNIQIPLITKYADINNVVKDYEDTSALIYKMLTNDNVTLFENNNKPLIK